MGISFAISSARFAEHLSNLVNADGLSNHEFMLLYWVSVKTSGGSRNERLQAGGFHASRTPGSIHYRMTFLMAKRSLLVNELTKGVTKSAHHIACFAA